MANETVRCKIIGVTPLLMHQAKHFIDRSSERGREFRELASKKKKTDADYSRLQEMEWRLSIYTNADGKPIMPGEIIEAMIASAVRKKKAGAKALCAVAVVGDPVVIHEGPKDIDALWKNDRFRDVRGVVVQRARVERCRPRFDAWSLEFDIDINTDLIDKRMVMAAIEEAGNIVGLGDYRPEKKDGRFGRFRVEWN